VTATLFPEPVKAPKRPKLPEPFASMKPSELCVRLTSIVRADYGDGSRFQCRTWCCPAGMLAPQFAEARAFCEATFKRIPACDSAEMWKRLRWPEGDA